MTAEQELPPSSVELHKLVLEVRRHNTIMRWYMFVHGAGLAILLLLQVPLVQSFLNYALTAAVIVAVLLTAPWWIKAAAFLAERLPWAPKGQTRSNAGRAA
jgi:hypothetical protein